MHLDKQHAMSSHEFAKCIYVDGGIFENILHYLNCTKFVTWTINTGIRNST
jgi:hypothetical protein